MERRRRRNRRKQPSAFEVLTPMLFAAAVVIAVVVAVMLPGESTQGNGQTENTGEQTLNSTQNTSPLADLVIAYPTQDHFLTLERQLVFTGTADPRAGFVINDQAVTVAEDGSFSWPVELQSGENEITVRYDGQVSTYTVEHRYTVQSYSPGAADVSYGSGATIYVELMAREGSTIEVTLGEKNIEMKQFQNQIGTGVAEGFVYYMGTYKLSASNTQEEELGQIRYTVTCDGVTETYTSGNITVQPTVSVKSSDPSVTPDYGNYVDVGSGYIVEVVTYAAETFNGKTTDDNSSPLNNYLPQGTVDYASTTPVKNGDISYMLLRCGRRVYIQKNNYPSSQKVQVIDCYYGTLPDHNEIGFVSMTQSGHYTTLTLDVLWKAPFYFDILPQSYINESIRDFRVTEVTAQYVDITFCYATVFEGEVTIPQDNLLFSKAELIQNESDCTLRLYLKQTGGFYGWDAYYNEADQLCFRFLNPTAATATDANAYGADLTGIRILIDVGHGGIDGGSVATSAGGRTVDEAELNLELANILKEELESMGATVILNRDGDTTLNTDERIRNFKEVWPDICISIHQNSISGYPEVNGLQVCYSTVFSHALAQLMYDNTVSAGLYTKNVTAWHYYFVARQTNCPTVLMENGYMSNAGDLAGMVSEDTLRLKAQAMAEAVATYFLNIG